MTCWIVAVKCVVATATSALDVAHAAYQEHYVPSAQAACLIGLPLPKAVQGMWYVSQLQTAFLYRYSVAASASTVCSCEVAIHKCSLCRRLESDCT